MAPILPGSGLDEDITALFALMDENGDGTIDEREVRPPCQIRRPPCHIRRMRLEAVRGCSALPLAITRFVAGARGGWFAHPQPDHLLEGDRTRASSAAAAPPPFVLPLPRAPQRLAAP